MAPETLTVDALGSTDMELVSALLEATEAAQSWIETKVFRRDHRQRRKDIHRLELLGYLLKQRDEDREIYRVSLTAMAQMPRNVLAISLLSRADKIWSAFFEHYDKSLDAPLKLETLATAIAEPLEVVARVHDYMQEWWRTPRPCKPIGDPDQYVVVQDDVLDFESFADCLEELRKVQASRLQTAQHGFVPLSQLHLDGVPPPQEVSARPVMKEPSWFWKLPQHAQALMREIHVAQYAGLTALPAMGVRAVIDVTADHILGEAIFGFDAKLKRLREKGHLTSRQFDAIDAVVEVGHAAVHRAHVPDASDLQLMREAMEHMLCAAYGLNDAQQQLAAKTPPKPNKGKPNKAN